MNTFRNENTALNALERLIDGESSHTADGRNIRKRDISNWLSMAEPFRRALGADVDRPNFAFLGLAIAHGEPGPLRIEFVRERAEEMRVFVEDNNSAQFTETACSVPDWDTMLGVLERMYNGDAQRSAIFDWVELGLIDEATALRLRDHFGIAPEHDETMGLLKDALAPRRLPPLDGMVDRVIELAKVTTDDGDRWQRIQSWRAGGVDIDDMQGDLLIRVANQVREILAPSALDDDPTPSLVRTLLEGAIHQERITALAHASFSEWVGRYASTPSVRRVARMGGAQQHAADDAEMRERGDEDDPPSGGLSVDDPRAVAGFIAHFGDDPNIAAFAESRGWRRSGGDMWWNPDEMLEVRTEVTPPADSSKNIEAEASRFGEPNDASPIPEGLLKTLEETATATSRTLGSDSIPEMLLRTLSDLLGHEVPSLTPGKFKLKIKGISLSFED